MIAYNQEWLNNLYIKEETREALEENCITDEEYISINTKYPIGFYTPNIFIRIGLFILTIIILLFSFGLLFLIFSPNHEAEMGSLAIFFAIGCFAALEMMIHVKKHFCSGVDDGVLWGGAIALLSGICLPNNFNELTNCCITFIISIFGTLRYADKTMIAIAYFSFLGFVFYTCIELGQSAKAIMPFIIMAISLLAYFSTKKIKSKNETSYYNDCLSVLEIVALISLYTAGNYFVVRELSNELFNLQLQPSESIPFGWVFWIFTITLPIVYAARGIQKKDMIILRVGLLLFAAIVFTVRYYHTILPIEIMMSVGGIILLVISYGIMKWLQQPQYGFTSKEIVSKTKNNLRQLEALIILQTFKPGTNTDTSKFGGGNFGGGGASGEY